ncbi:RluA family pseudouridine synthase [Ferroacidibacillus organovorans]|uniref:RNA pseudouridylate synthase n=1 Tax=Ferroacidibacillus organovorans TaxID=1765683 RepID=A0A162TF68_9BACL|nr:RluA family pseudouridine synthase [Ferroacidibacillus organovorans]KYP80744.1 hypothetical protein AYJ22_10035 [Ferroacidibacillus organovorans]OAG93859.1 hypothetical protein AYW79_08345 [Ferroacidibacillus organovorans]OPG15876.1 hypothetical protein B2M26_09730 [Ferroacidibacillus organovorans]
MSGGSVRSYPVMRAVPLLEFLLEVEDGRGRNKIKSYLTHRQVSVDGRIVTRHDHPLLRGQQVQITDARGSAVRNLHGIRIVYEDDHLLVIDKPPGLLSIASEKERDRTAYHILSDYVREKAPQSAPRGSSHLARSRQGTATKTAIRPESRAVRGATEARDPRIFVVHRLDRDTSGLMMFAKTERVKRALQDHWRDYVLSRSYATVVEGRVTPLEGTLTAWLKENQSQKMYVTGAIEGAEKATLSYRVARSTRAYSLLYVELETGKKNQIRVQMEHFGHSVVGDRRYGSKHNPLGRLGLHALTLEFKHPVRNDVLRFETDLPYGFQKLFPEKK